MVEIDIPGHRRLNLCHLVLDFNGTIAFDGKLIEGVSSRIRELALLLDIHVITADTRGTVKEELGGLPCTVHTISRGNEAIAKRNYIRNLSSSETASIGNGMNDRLMLEEASLGIAVLGGEGTALEAIRAADILAPHITGALELILLPLRLKATLRS